MVDASSRSSGPSFKLRWQDAIIDARGLRPLDKLVGLVCARYARPDGSEVRPSVETLAEATETHRTTVSRARRRLVEAGWLFEVERGSSKGGPRTSVFRLTFPPTVRPAAECDGSAVVEPPAPVAECDTSPTPTSSETQHVDNPDLMHQRTRPVAPAHTTCSTSATPTPSEPRQNPNAAACTTTARTTDRDAAAAANGQTPDQVLAAAVDLALDQLGHRTRAASKTNPAGWLRSAAAGVRADLIAADAWARIAQGASPADLVALIDPAGAPERPRATPLDSTQAAARARAEQTRARREGRTCQTCYGSPWCPPGGDAIERCPECGVDHRERLGVA